MEGGNNLGEKLTPREMKFIDAMLTEPTIEKACQKAGVSRATGHKYLRKTIVKRTIQTKQNEIMDRTTQTLYTASTNAVVVLNNIMTDGKVNPFVRVQAGKVILEQAYKAYELVGVAKQIEEVRAEIEEISKGN
ncbi:replication protein [Streptococcus equinus]|jgi:phage terminase small subunit|uniref:replication protein n=1 Tax=Streptococcus equinus TaxID=1335 RepID=UPI003C6FD123